MKIREASVGDAAAVGAIYGHHVLNSLGTFEEVPPSDTDIAERIAGVLKLGLPYLVAEDDGGRVLGFAYASPFRPRGAYRYIAEESVYVHPDMVGRGIGKALVAEVIGVCEAMGLRQLVAVIGDSANAASRGLHRSLGFTEIGIGRAFGHKHGRWVDIVWLQRPLGPGAEVDPSGPGLEL